MTEWLQNDRKKEKEKKNFFCFCFISQLMHAGTGEDTGAGENLIR